MTRKTKRVLKGTVAGLAGGLAGTIAMTQFQNLWNRMMGGSSSGGEPATVKAAVRLFHVPKDRKKTAGQIVHYSFGALNGAMYGAVAEVEPKASMCAGTLFGATLFVVVDETLVPLLGWSKPPQDYPLTSHLYGFASHLIYGLTTDGVRRAVRSAL
jgi:uncharacterized membrane protein YagU involved in acid resistance